MLGGARYDAECALAPLSPPAPLAAAALFSGEELCVECVDVEWEAAGGDSDTAEGERSGGDETADEDDSEGEKERGGPLLTPPGLGGGAGELYEAATAPGGSRGGGVYVMVWYGGRGGGVGPVSSTLLCVMEMAA